MKKNEILNLKRHKSQNCAGGGVFTGLILASIVVLSSCGQKGLRETKTTGTSAFLWEQATPESQGMSKVKLDSMTSHLAERGTKKLLIIKNDKIVYEWHARGSGDSESKHYTASLAKAIVSGMSLLGALDDGYIHLDEAACNYIPAWKTDYRKSKITIRQLATHTSGMVDAEGTEAEVNKLKAKGLDRHFDLPGWKGQFWRKDPDPFTVSRDSTPVICSQGERFAYSNPGIAMLNYAVTASFKGSKYNDIRSYLKDRIYGPIGLAEQDYSIGYEQTYPVDGLGLVAGWGGGDFTARAVGCIGLLMLHKGNWQGRQIVDSANVEKVTSYAGTATPRMNLNNVISLLSDQSTAKNPSPAPTAGWYCNFDGTLPNLPRDAFMGKGAGNQILLVVPSMNMVVVRMGDDLFDASKAEGSRQCLVKWLFDPLMDAVEEPPYPMSDIHAKFAPQDSVIRLAKGSDNWPVTWTDDGEMYAAYGDGNGFRPYTDIKLSLGLARVTGYPPFVRGINIRTLSGERVGDGKYGVKASGMLMVDKTLYLLTRNAQNAALMWSSDYGITWKEADWKFDVSFGCPAFLNYGKNYEGAADSYVYIYSHDEAGAYKNSDHFVLARVLKNQVKDWRNYEYFAGLQDGDKPIWSDDIRKREPVFTNPGKCYRSGITYNKGLGRYLWCQAIQLSPSEKYTDLRFGGGLGIFESSRPWGPWKTVYYTREWDMGPGETSSIPAKWISNDGKTAYLLFSGNDCFSLRKVNFEKSVK